MAKRSTDRAHTLSSISLKQKKGYIIRKQGYTVIRRFNRTYRRSPSGALIFVSGYWEQMEDSTPLLSPAAEGGSLLQRMWRVVRRSCLCCVRPEGSWNMKKHDWLKKKTKKNTKKHIKTWKAAVCTRTSCKEKNFKIQKYKNTWNAALPWLVRWSEAHMKRRQHVILWFK